MRIDIQNVRVIDPASGMDEVRNVSIIDGRLHLATPAPDAGAGADTRTIDASGCLLTPGWIDAHVHLRDPGQPHKEDLQSGAEAAVAGGFTRLCCMPNTVPALDTPELILDVIKRGAATGVHIHPIGCISLGRRGDELAPLAAMAAAGAIGFSDDGDSTRSEDVMREALTLTRTLNLPIMVHVEDPVLGRAGALHQGPVATELGDPGIPAIAEESYIERDLRLAEETGGWLHVLHVSTRRGIELIRAAQQRGVQVTAEVMTHHMLLTDEWAAGRRRYAGEPASSTVAGPCPDLDAKVNPPLRPEADALGLIDALQQGWFNFIATDHAPHAPEEKSGTLATAAFGMTGLELALPVMTRLVERDDLTWPQAVAFLTTAPATTLNLPGGRLQDGELADLVVIDPRTEWVISRDTIRSRSANTPMLGMSVRGRAKLTLSNGKVLHDEFPAN